MRELFAKDKGGKLKHWTIEVEGNEIIVRHGKFGGKMQEKRTICKGKNKGRANETTDEEQAQLEADSKYQHQIDKLYRPTQEEAKSVGEVLPMLAKNYLDSGHRIKYPCYTSPKLDGVRCIATIDYLGNVVLNSRGGKTYDCPEHVRKDLVALWKETEINKFDGELYIHGMPLQDIVSAVKKPNENTPHLSYHIFDIPSSLIWVERLEDLNEVKACSVDLKSIEVVPNLLVETEEEAREQLSRWLINDFEGLMLRNLDGAYEYNHRSADLQKWKLMQDMEARVVGYSVDKNSEYVFHCVVENGEFDVKMKGDHASRQIDHTGKWITVQYQALTNKGLPQFPVGLCVRECDEFGNPII